MCPIRISDIIFCLIHKSCQLTTATVLGFSVAKFLAFTAPNLPQLVLVSVPVFAHSTFFAAYPDTLFAVTWASFLPLPLTPAASYDARTLCWLLAWALFGALHCTGPLLTFSRTGNPQMHLLFWLFSCFFISVINMLLCDFRWHNAVHSAVCNNLCNPGHTLHQLPLQDMYLPCHPLGKQPLLIQCQGVHHSLVSVLLTGNCQHGLFWFQICPALAYRGWSHFMSFCWVMSVLVLSHLCAVFSSPTLNFSFKENFR